MEITTLVNLVVQNGFMLIFACTGLYFLIKVGNIYTDRLACKNNKLDDKVVMTLIRAVVWYHSRGKLRHLEAILVENDIIRRKDEITRKVRNSLEERTMVYLEYFNTLNTNIERLGDFYGKTFEMDAFFKEVMDVVLRSYEHEDHGNEIAVKIQDISEIMFLYQEKANLKVEEQLHLITK